MPLRPLLLAALIAFAYAPAAHAAGVGFSLPKFRVLSLNEGTTTATSVGGSVQVIGTTLGLGHAQLDLGFDYAYTHDFASAANYAFFDLGVGVGLPLAIAPRFYLTPAVDTHTLFFAASPQGINGPGFGLAPRLTVGFEPTRAIRVELSASQAFLLALTAPRRSLGGGMTIVEVGGSYSF